LPIHSGNVAFKAETPWFEFLSEEIISGSRNTSFYGSYSHDLPVNFVTNLSALKNIKVKKLNFSLEFRLNNVLNKSYQMILWRPMPGRNASFVISCKI
jgi:hypothetical protein